MHQDFSYELSQVMPEAVATGLFVSRFTAQAPSGNYGPTGAPDGVYVPVAGLIDLKCTAPPTSELRIRATEVKTLQEILSLQIKHVLLDKYYPALDDASDQGWNCLIDGVAHDLIGVEHDSQFQMSRIEVRLAGI